MTLKCSPVSATGGRCRPTSGGRGGEPASPAATPPGKHSQWLNSTPVITLTLLLALRFALLPFCDGTFLSKVDSVSMSLFFFHDSSLFLILFFLPWNKKEHFQEVCLTKNIRMIWNRSVDNQLIHPQVWKMINCQLFWWLMNHFRHFSSKLSDIWQFQLLFLNVRIWTGGRTKEAICRLHFVLQEI